MLRLRRRRLVTVRDCGMLVPLGTLVTNTTQIMITKILTSRLNKVTNTNQFEATHAIKRIYQSIRLNKNSLKSYAVKYKVEINDHQSMFNSYINSYSISNIKLKGLRGLSYLQYEYEQTTPFCLRNPT